MSNQSPINNGATAPPIPQVTIPTNILPLPKDQQQPVQFTNIPPAAYATLQQDRRSSTPKEELTRAGLTVKPRLVAMTGMGSLWGFGIGAFLGGRQSGLQYLAENAHRLPTTVQGWYFYHKTKNYRVMLGGIKRGARYAFKTGGLCLVYGAIEAGMDDIRGEADVFNSVAAGISTATLFASLTKLPRSSFRYSMLFGAMLGLTTGGLSDLHKTLSGLPPRYLQPFVPSEN